ncbi:unnamed protein product, partial [Ixodes hexagonus]
MEGHSCVPKCALCGGAHRTYDSHCPEKFSRRDKLREPGGAARGAATGSSRCAGCRRSGVAQGRVLAPAADQQAAREIRHARRLLPRRKGRGNAVKAERSAMGIKDLCRGTGGTWTWGTRRSGP